MIEFVVPPEPATASNGLLTRLREAGSRAMDAVKKIAFVATCIGRLFRPRLRLSG
jgi:hypothetical protein